MAAGSLDRGQVVLHGTYGPGRIVSATGPTVEVEFHDGRRESFKRTHAEETLTACGTDGFSARLLADRHAVLRTLEENPREAFGWLSQDLHREIRARSVKPLLKALNILPGGALDTAWERVTRRLRSQAPKKRMAD